MPEFVEIVCVTNNYYHGVHGEICTYHPELEVNKKYIARSMKKMSNSNIGHFYEIKAFQKMYRKEMFKTVIEFRDYKLEGILCD